MRKIYSMSRSVVSNYSVMRSGCSHILLLVFLLLACIIGVEATAENGLSKQQGNLTIQSLKTLIASEERLSLAKTLAETAGVEILRRFVEKDELYAKRLGFDSLSQVTDGRPVALPPFPVFRIGLTQLQNYDGNAAMLLAQKGVAQFVVPITVEKQDKALSAITVRLGGDRKSDKIIQWGSRNLIRQLSKRRGELAKDKGISDLTLFVMEIPAFNRLYLGYIKAPETVMLIPISGVQASDDIMEQPIEEVFKALAMEARVAGDDPR